MSEATAAPAVTSTAPVAQNAQNTSTSQPSTQTQNHSPSPGVPAQTATTAKESSKAPEYYEIKVNGQPRRMTLEQMKSAALLGMGANERFEAAAKERQAIEQIQNRFDTDPIEATIMFYESRGNNRQQAERMAREKFEVAYKSRFIDPETMTPEQRQIAEVQRQLEEQKAWRTQREQEDQQRANETQDNEARASLQKEVIDFLDSYKFPKTRFFASRYAYWKRLDMEKGYDAPAEVISQQVRGEMTDVVKSLIEQSTGEQIVELLGEEIIHKLRKFDLARLKTKFNVSRSPVTAKGNVAPRERKASTMRDVDKYFNDIRRTPRPR